MLKLHVLTCCAMSKANKYCPLVRYYGKRLQVKNSNSMRSIRISQKNKELRPLATSRRLSAGIEILSETNADAGNILQITKEAKKTEDDRFHALIDSLRNRSTREKLGLTYIAGASLIREAICKGVLFQEIYFHDSADLQTLPHQTLMDCGVEFVHVSKESFSKHLNAELCTDGLLAVFAIPFRQRISKAPAYETLPATVICDNIRDPGNMGMIFQSSVAISCIRILVTTGCVDVWEPKVLQMGRGAHFDASFHTSLDWKEIGEILPADSRIYLADCSAVDASDLSTDEEQRNSDTKETNTSVHEYDCVDYCNGHAVVVIGGETEGISRQAFDFSRTRKQPGCRIHIPMMSGINSLNSAVAGSIILFEIARQMKQSGHN